MPRALPARLIYGSLKPDSVAPGGTLSASVQTAGTVTRAVLYLGSGPGGPAPQQFDLAESSPGTWTSTVTAPTIPGTYHFTVALFGATGRRLLFDNDNWNVTVGSGQAAPAQAQPLPADIPLSPPFSYGNPVAAVFSAAGRTVSGSEVSSNTRPDVSASLVAQFYAIHLPRAGWNVDSSSVPAAGATSFSIVGTETGRVVVVQFSGGTVHIFYGNLPG